MRRISPHHSPAISGRLARSRCLHIIAGDQSVPICGNSAIIDRSGHVGRQSDRHRHASGCGCAPTIIADLRPDRLSASLSDDDVRVGVIATIAMLLPVRSCRGARNYPVVIGAAIQMVCPLKLSADMTAPSGVGSTSIVHNQHKVHDLHNLHDGQISEIDHGKKGQVAYLPRRRTHR